MMNSQYVILDDVFSPITEAARHGKPTDLGGMTSLPEKVRAATNNRLYIIGVTTQVVRLKGTNDRACLFLQSIDLPPIYLSSYLNRAILSIYIEPR